MGWEATSVKTSTKRPFSLFQISIHLSFRHVNFSRKRAVCDSSSDSSSSDNTGSCAGTDDITPEDDKNFMKKAQDFAKRSGDNNTKVSSNAHTHKCTSHAWGREGVVVQGKLPPTQMFHFPPYFTLKHYATPHSPHYRLAKSVTCLHDSLLPCPFSPQAKIWPSCCLQIGAIIVDRKSKKIIGEGWNRLPKNCEDRFKWSRDEGEPFEYSKHLYGEELWIERIIKIHPYLSI